MSYQPDLPAEAVHARLVEAVRSLNQAEHHVVVWFAEVRRRRLYRAFDCASMRQYAVTRLGFSATRAADLDRLAACLDQLPRLRASMASGELGYTKAREIVKVASPRTEAEWMRTAASSSRRELEAKVRRVRRKAQTRRAARVGQGELLPSAETAVETRLAAAAPVRIGLQLTAEQAARYEALWQELGRAPNAEDLLAALAALVEARGTVNGVSDCDDGRSAAAVPRGTHPPVQIHVHRCPECGAMEAAGRLLDRADAARAACDAAVSEPGGRNTTTIPPRTRRAVLARDRHRCRAPGCTHQHFLEVHHLVPRARGGTNEPANLITLCSACHRLWHERGRPGWASGIHDTSSGKEHREQLVR